jgi:hypothetical protein
LRRKSQTALTSSSATHAPLERADDLRRLRLDQRQPRRRLPRLLALGPRGLDLVAQTAQILDQREPQHDRDRPHLADRQRGGLLVAVDEPGHGLRVEAAGRVRDQFPCDHVHAGIALKTAARELR